LKIKSKLDILTAVIVILFLIILGATLISSRYVHKNTVSLVNISKELDFLTLLKSSLTHLEYHLEGFISRPDKVSKKSVEEALDRLYRIVSRTEDIILDEEERDIMVHLRENMAGFSSKIHRIIITTDMYEKGILFSELKRDLFMKIGSEIERHWDEDLEKVKRLQKESEKGLAISSYISIGTFFILLISVFIIRNFIKRKAIDPIQEISHLSFEMAEGKLDREINISSKDELQDLANNFNLMARTLREKLMDLENRVSKEQRMVRELAILSEFISYASSETEFEVVIRRFTEVARDLLRAQGSAVFLLKLDGSRLFISTDDRFREEIIEDLLGITPERAIEAQTTIINNNAMTEISESLKVRNFIALPIRSTAEIEGLVIIFNRDNGFMNEDEDSLFNFAFQSFYIIALQNKLAMLATTDGLTGLYNHRTFQDRLSEELIRAERYNKSIILLLLDIDHFKRFNDTYGHQTGDEVLKTIAKIIRGNTRKVDLPARYGGEEFVIILPESDCEHARVIAERIRTAVMEYPFYVKDGSRVQLTVSIGISCFPKDATEKVDLIKKADIALYNAKKEGRNRVCLFCEM